MEHNPRHGAQHSSHGRMVIEGIKLNGFLGHKRPIGRQVIGISYPIQKSKRPLKIASRFIPGYAKTRQTKRKKKSTPNEKPNGHLDVPWKVNAHLLQTFACLGTFFKQINKEVPQGFNFRIRRKIEPTATIKWFTQSGRSGNSRSDFPPSLGFFWRNQFRKRASGAISGNK